MKPGLPALNAASALSIAIAKLLVSAPATAKDCTAFAAAVSTAGNPVSWVRSAPSTGRLVARAPVWPAAVAIVLAHWPSSCNPATEAAPSRVSVSKVSGPRFSAATASEPVTDGLLALSGWLRFQVKPACAVLRPSPLTSGNVA